MNAQRFAIIDVETTGGRAARDKVTEIAIVVHDGEKVVDTFSSLINPEMPIPSYIVELTGITNEMVADAPHFWQVAKTVVEMTEGAYFVAHNARFDYSFIREEFRRLGYTYTRKTLCTLQLSRKAFPGLSSYSLGNLIRHFGIRVEDRHRALADTLATTDLFARILQTQGGQAQLQHLIKMGVKESLLPISIGIDKIRALPEECGVYYFHDRSGDVVYVGKSINIQKRIAEHFQDKTQKALKLQQHAHDISFEITGSELIALLHESTEIKRLRPPINRAQRNQQFPYGVFAYTSDDGYLSFTPAKTTAKMLREKTLLAEYPHLESARNHLHAMVERYQLCEKRCGLETGNGPCFHYQLSSCLGACVAEESPEEYNARAQEALEALAAVLEGSFVLLDRGRSDDERSAIVVENGRLYGWGFIAPEDQARDLDGWKDLVKPTSENAELNRLIKRHLHRKNLRILAY